MEKITIRTRFKTTKKRKFHSLRPFVIASGGWEPGREVVLER